MTDRWRVQGYYNKSVKPPKKPDELAISVICSGKSAKDLEWTALKERKDIGLIIINSLN